MECPAVPGRRRGHAVDRPVDHRDTDGIVRYAPRHVEPSRPSPNPISPASPRAAPSTAPPRARDPVPAGRPRHMGLSRPGSDGRDRGRGRRDPDHRGRHHPRRIRGRDRGLRLDPSTATVRARTEARLLRIEQTVVRRHLSSSPETALAIIADLGRRLQNLNSTLATLTRAADALAKGNSTPPCSMRSGHRPAASPISQTSSNAWRGAS